MTDERIDTTDGADATDERHDEAGTDVDERVIEFLRSAEQPRRLAIEPLWRR